MLQAQLDTLRQKLEGMQGCMEGPRSQAQSIAQALTFDVDTGMEGVGGEAHVWKGVLTSGDSRVEVGGDVAPG